MSNDDAEEDNKGKINTISSDLETTNTIGLRFTNLSIPKNATVLKSYIQFKTDEISTKKSNLIIKIEDSTDAKLFLNIPFNISSRKKTKQSIKWKPNPWNIVGERSSIQRTSELKNLIQPLVDTESWNENSSIVFIITGEGKRVAKSFKDHSKKRDSYAPSIYIEYTIDQKRSVKTSSNQQHIKINEILTSNGSINIDPDEKSFSDWIELYNDSNTTQNISGFYLSNDSNITKWQIPNQTFIPPYGYLLIWADEKDKNLIDLHTNFKLSRKKGLLTLASKEYKIIDYIVYEKQQRDISCKKQNNSIVYMPPTPNRKNSPIFKKNKESKKPFFSLKSGFYKTTQTLKLSHKKDAPIYYTTDGSIPTTSSKKYTLPIDISKTTVIRARAFHKNRFPSDIVNHTYFIDENISLPVVSLAINDNYLYDENIGISHNYKKRWMRPASIMYFKDQKLEFTENIGIKISGNNTRGYPQKSFAIFAKKKYGSKSIKYPLFRDKPHIKKIKSFLLRNSGTHWGSNMMSEGVSHTIVKDNMDIDYQSFHPVVMFLNGKYWGIYNIREKMNIDYLKSNHNIGSKKVDLIEDDDSIKEGNIKEYKALLEYIKSHDMSNDNYFTKASSQIDMKEFINYIIIQSFFGNSSIHHNIKRWKLKKGKWRTLLFDLDRGFQNATDTILGKVLDDDETSIIFNHFLQNKNFINQFTSSYFSHLNTTFQTQRIDKFITKAKEEIEPEIKRHFEKWSLNKNGEPVSIKTWKIAVDKMYLFSKNRNSIVRAKLKEAFNTRRRELKKMKLGME